MIKKVRTHYDNLKVSRDAPTAVIKSAFKALSLSYHPDRSEDKEEAERIFKIIRSSYEILIDPEARRKHDEWIKNQEKNKDSNDKIFQDSEPRSKKPSIKKTFLVQQFLIRIVSALRGIYRSRSTPKVLFFLFSVASTYQMWSWSQSSVKYEFLDRFLTRKQTQILSEMSVTELDETTKFVDEFNIDIKMVSLPEGEYFMGSNSGVPDELPVHRVSLRPFMLGAYEVTFDIWDMCYRAKGCRTMPDDKGWGRGDKPVINISYDDINEEFIPWLNKITGLEYRLPTEAEWEYAAKAGVNTHYYWGNQLRQNMANCSNQCGDSFRYSAPVGSFGPNDWGLYDMHGNVWEWVMDCDSINYQNAPNDGSAYIDDVCQKHVTRGGSWGSNAQDARATARSRMYTSERFYSLGFRLARNAGEESSVQLRHSPSPETVSESNPDIISTLNEWFANGYLTEVELDIAKEKILQ